MNWKKRAIWMLIGLTVSVPFCNAAEIEKATDAEKKAYDNPDIELQKSAVFTLSQNHSSTSVQKLINIARNHKSAKVRKEAIFWLGQMDSEEAVDAIIKLAEED